jgi:hypothetical protein
MQSKHALSKAMMLWLKPRGHPIGYFGTAVEQIQPHAILTH